MSKLIKTMILALQTILFSLLLIPGFLLDLFLYILTNKNECLNCGWNEIIKKGVYTKLLLAKIKNNQFIKNEKNE